MSGHEGERLCAYLDSELPPGERTEVEAHLAACPACTALLADMTAVDAAATALPAEAPEGYFDAFPSRVVARLGAASMAPARTRRLPTWTWAAAAALLLAVVAPLTLREPAPVPATASAPRPAHADADQKREQDSLSATGGPAVPAARPRPAFASPPPAALPAPPAAPAESATSRPKLADAPTQMGVRDPPAVVRTEALAAPEESARAPARRAPAPASASMESSAHRDERTAGAVSVPEAERAFGSLEASRPRTAAEWRRLREAWSSFAAAHPDDPRADEARVRAIEAGREAWLAGGAADDEEAFQRDGRAYLAREDARQKERVARLLPPRRP